MIEKRHKVYKNIFETIIGIEEVKIYRAEGYFMKKPAEDLKNVFKISIIYNLIKELPQKLIEITAVVSVVAIFYIGSLLLLIEKVFLAY